MEIGEGGGSRHGEEEGRGDEEEREKENEEDVAELEEEEEEEEGDDEEYAIEFDEETNPLDFIEEAADGVELYQQFERLEYEALAERKRKALQDRVDRGEPSKKPRRDEFLGATMEEINEMMNFGMRRRKRSRAPRKRGRKKGSRNKFTPEVSRKIGDATLHNSVGFYQMTKLAIIPCTILLETLFFRKRFSRSIQFSLTILLLGVGIATVTDLQLNLLGSVLSLLAVFTTCIAQIMTNTIQKRFKVSSTQLLYQSCPYQALTLFIVGPFLDGLLTNQNVFAFNYTPQVLVFIVLSCLISVSVNFSTFLVIGKTSPVTYQVLGHLKTCLVLAFGYVLLHDPFSWRNIVGILIALVGMILYSYFCSMESQQKAVESSTQLSQESESDPLIGVENGSDGVASKGPIWSSNKDFQA